MVRRFLLGGLVVLAVAAGGRGDDKAGKAAAPTQSKWSLMRASSARIVRTYLQRGVISMPNNFSTV